MSTHNGTTMQHDQVSGVGINIAFSVVITSVAIPSNFLLLLVFCNFEDIRDLNNTAITMLSITDFLRGCIVMTTKIYSQIAGVDYLGPFACNLTALICAFSSVFSPLMLALISFVRYRIVIPFSPQCWHLTRRKFYVILAGLFVIASLFSILPYMGVGDYGYSHAHGVCFVDWREVNKVFRAIFYIIVIGIAFPILTFSYTMLYASLRKHNKTTARMMSLANHSYIPNTLKSDTERKRSRTNSSTKDLIAVICENESQIPSVPPIGGDIKRKRSQFRENMSKQENQVTKILLFIFIAYIVCWFPAFLVDVFSFAHRFVSPIWYYIIVTLVDLKSALDPVIYGLGNKKYRERIGNMVKGGLTLFRKQ